MNDPANHIPDDVDRLLRQHFDRQAERADTQPLFERIQTTLAADAPKLLPTPVPRSSRLGRWARWAGMMTAAAVLFLAGMYFNRPDQPVRASPQELLQEAQQIHHRDVDRCYLIEVHYDPQLTVEQNPFAAQARKNLLWTRGDRFWIDSSGPWRKLAWGRDEEGTIWMTDGRTEGIRIGAHEAPQWLNAFSDLCTMQPEKLIGEVLRDFNLRREDDDKSPVHVIRAELKPGRFHPSLRTCVLELDAESKVLRRVVLQRLWAGRTVTTSYTLIESLTLANSDRYRIEGHLRKGSNKMEIYTSDYKPEERGRFMRILFGQRAADWFRPPMAPIKKFNP